MTDSTPSGDATLPETNTETAIPYSDEALDDHDLRAEDVDAILEQVCDDLDSFHINTLFSLFSVLSGIDPADTPEKAAATSDDPVVPTDLLIQRAQNYRAQGVPALRAMSLALDDAIGSIEEAESLDHSGEICALGSY